MQSWMIVSAATVFATGWLPDLPPAAPSFFVLGFTFLWALWRPARWSISVLGIACGLCYGQLWGMQLLEQRLPEELEGEILEVDALVLEPPQLRYFSGTGRRQRFAAELTRLACPQDVDACPESIPKVLLSYYGAQDLRPGERWRVQVRLKRPWGLANPDSFNYQSWLAQNRFAATGYVRDKSLRRLEPQGGLLWHQRWRGVVADALRDALPAGPERGVLLALSNGDRSDIGSDYWQLFQRYGLNHLVVISGLHVGLVAGIGFLLGRIFGRRSAHSLAAALALIYAALAGFGLPTVRALVMLASVQLLALAGRRITALRCLALALFVIALLDPLATHNAGFWLSFGAVALIFYVRAMHPDLPGWRLTLMLQVILSLTMGLVASFWYGGFGLLAPLANLVAVPVLGFWLAPLCLAAALVQPLDPSWAPALWKLASVPVAAGIRFDAWIAQFEPGLWLSYKPGLIELAAALLAVLLLLAHRALPLRWLGLVFLILPLFPQRQELPAGALELWTLDVGQGLAVLVQTRHRVLVYDTGAGDPAGPNMASSVMVPFLQARGIRDIDLLVLSHGDRDHASGVYTLHRQFTIQRTWFGEQAFPGIAGQSGCRTGDTLKLDELSIRVLHPIAPGEGNNQSCVLLLEHRGYRILLPGDIEAGVEHRLNREAGPELHADLLLVPHHGSKTSSSSSFLRRVNPHRAILSRGYRNRFGHPHARVLARYRALGLEPMDTARDGALRVRVEDGKEVLAEGWRQRRQYYWY